MAGRPTKEIDAKTFEKLCFLQCTLEEICGFLEVSDKTLYSWCKRTYGRQYSEVYAEKRQNGKISLRRAQFELAKRSASMAIFLGKNILGQRDSYEVDNQEALAKLDEIMAALPRGAE